jgi:seryl-tRNA synthetase
MSARQQQVYQGLIAAGFIDEHMHQSKNSNSNNLEENSTSDSTQRVKKEKKSIFAWGKKKKDKDKKKEKELPSNPTDVANSGHSQTGVAPLSHNQVQLRKTPTRNQGTSFNPSLVLLAYFIFRNWLF